jgi:hypothetical protein
MAALGMLKHTGLQQRKITLSCCSGHASRGALGLTTTPGGDTGNMSSGHWGFEQWARGFGSRFEVHKRALSRMKWGNNGRQDLATNYVYCGWHGSKAAANAFVLLAEG